MLPRPYGPLIIIYFIIESYRKYTRKKTVYTIKHHTLICAQETDNVIYKITELAR